MAISEGTGFNNPFGGPFANLGAGHQMKDHVFTPGTYGPARLYYQGDVPILEVDSDKPYEAGRAQGHLVGPVLQKCLQQLTLGQMVTGHTPQKLSRTLEKIISTIPPDYLEEMQGIVDGYNAWSAEKGGTSTAITLDDLALFHLIPERCHFVPEELRDPPKKVSKRQKKSVACTVVLDRDKDKGITFGRTLDWPSEGMENFGSRSLVINRKYSVLEKPSTVEIGFPGLVGTFTGMNESGLSLAMNVCSGDTEEIKGMPATFFNRMCLERAKVVDDVAQLLTTQGPLGCYHLTVADSESARTFHLYQGPKEQHVERPLKDRSPLITTNFRYPSQTRTTDDLSESRERTKVVTELFKKTRSCEPKKSVAELVTESLAVSPVDNVDTIHKIVMYPATKKMSVAFDDQLAGRVPLQELDTTELFTRAAAKRPSDAAPSAASSTDSRKRAAPPMEEAELPPRKRVCLDRCGAEDDPIDLT